MIRLDYNKFIPSDLEPPGWSDNELFTQLLSERERNLRFQIWLLFLWNVFSGDSLSKSLGSITSILRLNLAEDGSHWHFHFPSRWSQALTRSPLVVTKVGSDKLGRSVLLDTMMTGIRRFLSAQQLSISSMSLSSFVKDPGLSREYTNIAASDFWIAIRLIA